MKRIYNNQYDTKIEAEKRPTTAENAYRYGYYDPDLENNEFLNLKNKSISKDSGKKSNISHWHRIDGQHSGMEILTSNCKYDAYWRKLFNGVCKKGNEIKWLNKTLPKARIAYSKKDPIMTDKMYNFLNKYLKEINEK